MIKNLQKKFIFISMVSIFLVTFTILSAINLANYARVNHELDNTLELISSNDGEFPSFKAVHKENHGIPITPETEFSLRYFSIRIDSANRITTVNTQHIAAVSREKAKTIVSKIISAKKDKGFWGEYKYMRSKGENDTLIVFLDCTDNVQFINNIFALSIFIAFTGLIVVFFLLWTFSKSILTPFIKNAEKQKQFITDAGHELKTPVAIILANVDVLELEDSDNEWLQSIRNQALRLDKLIKSMLRLAKMEESGEGLVFEEFIISNLVMEETNNFSPLAKNKIIETDIDKGLNYKGDKESIRQLITNLIENAIKYTPDGGKITIFLKPSGKNVKLCVKNETKDELSEETVKRLFDRFYRADNSRSRETGGFGIGLSIVQSVVLAHKGKLTVEKTGKKEICFACLI